jgi:diguanylate cyclase (GGDEF)-like protein
MPQKSKNIVVLLSGLVVFIFAYLLYDSYQEVKNTHQQAKVVIGEQDRKQHLLTTMYMAARERSILLLTMNTEDDIFQLDELTQEMSRQASIFIQARSQLDHLPMSSKEREIFEAGKNLVSENAPMQNIVGRLYMEGERKKARNLLFERAIPGQQKVLDQIRKMLELYERNAAVIISDIEQRTKNVTVKFQLLAIAFLAAAGFFLAYVFLSARREKKILQKNAAEKTYQASHDPLTGLINRWEFENRLTQLIDDQRGDETTVLLYLDLDQFKIVNDICGHRAGDQLLIQVAAIMRPCIGAADDLARTGGDEYGIILRSTSLDRAKEIADSLIQAVSEHRFYWEKQTFRVGVSIGIVEINDMTPSIEDALIRTDTACYAAKDGGRNRYHVYTESDRDLIHRQSEMDRVVQLERALGQDGFIIFAQPIMSTRNRDAQVNFELLIRLKSELGNPVPPGAFLPAAERFHKMIDIDRWVVSKALSVIGKAPDFLAQIGYCSINISRQSLSDSKFLDEFIATLMKYEKIELARKIVIEITETAALTNLTTANRCITQLRKIGVRFALDDFGSGLATFEYLKTLPVDYLKIDGMFVKNIAKDPIDRAMVKSIHEIGAIMGKVTIAEFVENKEILQVLRNIGIDYAQGYAIGKPMPLTKVIDTGRVDSNYGLG